MSLFTEGKLFNITNSESGGGGGAVESVNGHTGIVVLGAEDVGALADTTKYVASATWTIDSSTYVMTLQLKDQDGENVGTAQTIDLPLESVVVGGSYDSTNKKIVLTLNNGTTIDVPVADLVSGLQSEITAQDPLSADLVDDTNTTHKFVSAAEKSTWNGKQDAISDLATIRSGAAAGATAVQPNDLATVATTGDYDDLTNKPTIPAAQVNSDWNANSGVAQILNKPTLGTAASANTTDFATAAQGAKADTAIQSVKTINGQSIVGTGDVTVGGLPSQTGQSGKYLTTDGTDASWGTVNALQNTATGTNALTILGTSTNKDYAMNIGIGSVVFNVGDTVIGYNAYADGGREHSTAVGYSARADAPASVAIGGSARVSGSYTTGSVAIGGSTTATQAYCVSIGSNTSVTGWGAIQLGGYNITNSEAGTLYVGLTPYRSSNTANYKLLDSDGTIPEARLADTTNATAGQVLTLDSNLVATWATPSGGGASVPTLTWYTVSTAGNTLTIADTSSAQLVKVYKNGLLLQPTEDYSISGTTLTTVTAMVVGDKITTEVF